MPSESLLRPSVSSLHAFMRAGTTIRRPTHAPKSAVFRSRLDETATMSHLIAIMSGSFVAKSLFHAAESSGYARVHACLPIVNHVPVSSGRAPGSSSARSISPAGPPGSSSRERGTPARERARAHDRELHRRTREPHRRASEVRRATSSVLQGKSHDRRRDAQARGAVRRARGRAHRARVLAVEARRRTRGSLVNCSKTFSIAAWRSPARRSGSPPRSRSTRLREWSSSSQENDPSIEVPTTPSRLPLVRPCAQGCWSTWTNRDAAAITWQVTRG